MKTRTAAFSAISMAMLFGLCGCKNGHLSNSVRDESILSDHAQLAIKSTVIRAMGDSSGVPTCLLDVSDTEFAWIQREFEASPPKFNYSQATKTDSEKGYTTLAVKIISAQSDRALVAGMYISRKGFSQFRYELSREGDLWKITKKDFIGAS